MSCELSKEARLRNQARISLDKTNRVYGYADGAIGYGIRKVWISLLRILRIQRIYNTP